MVCAQSCTKTRVCAQAGLSVCMHGCLAVCMLSERVHACMCAWLSERVHSCMSERVCMRV